MIITCSRIFPYRKWGLAVLRRFLSLRLFWSSARTSRVTKPERVSLITKVSHKSSNRMDIWLISRKERDGKCFIIPIIPSKTLLTKSCHKLELFSRLWISGKIKISILWLIWSRWGWDTLYSCCSVKDNRGY